MLVKGLRWNVGNGESINIWKDGWVPSLRDFKVSFNPIFGNSVSSVNELIVKREGAWDSKVVMSLFNEVEWKAILSSPISVHDKPNSLVWHWSSNGVYTVNLGYSVL